MKGVESGCFEMYTIESTRLKRDRGREESQAK